jgi:hypothetical protein
MLAQRQGPDTGPALQGVMRREEDVMSTCKVIEVIGTSATSWPSPDMRNGSSSRGGTVRSPSARLGSCDDEGPVLRGRRTLWLRWHWLDSDCG